jgi:hypothetical protein
VEVYSLHKGVKVVAILLFLEHSPRAILEAMKNSKTV